MKATELGFKQALGACLALLTLATTNCSLAAKKSSEGMLTDQQRLSRASAQGDLPGVKTSLQGSAEIDELGPNQSSALMTAAYRGQSEVLNYLIDRGAHLEITDGIGQTALHHAAIGGHADSVRILLVHGAKVEARSALGLTPLMLATRFADAEAVTRLLAAGASPLATDPAGWTALFFAVARGHDVIYQRLLREGPLDFKHQDLDGNSVLHIAVLYRQPKIYRDLKARGAPENLKDKNGRDPKALAEANKVTI